MPKAIFGVGVFFPQRLIRQITQDLYVYSGAHFHPLRPSHGSLRPWPAAVLPAAAAVVVLAAYPLAAPAGGPVVEVVAASREAFEA
jgi:hypothetical protein